VKTARGLHDEISEDLFEIGNQLDALAGLIDCSPADRSSLRIIRGKVSILCELMSADIPTADEVSRTIFSVEIRQAISEINDLLDVSKIQGRTIDQLRELLGFPKHFLSQSKKTIRATEPLTKREKEVLLLLPRGLTAKAMASELFLTEATVKSHLAAIFRKFEVVNRTQAIAIAVESKILTF
jgi:DNA-binding CsgD family transcriptional regulator